MKGSETDRRLKSCQMGIAGNLITAVAMIPAVSP